VSTRSFDGLLNPVRRPYQAPKAGRHATANSDRPLSLLNAADVIKKGGLGDPQLRASREHIPIVRPLRAQGITQAALSAVQSKTKAR